MNTAGLRWPSPVAADWRQRLAELLAGRPDLLDADLLGAAVARAAREGA